MNNNVNVLHVIDHLGFGGAQKVVMGLVSDTVNRIWVYSLRKPNNEPSSYHKNVLEYQSKNRFSINPLFSLIDIVDKKQIDILHCHLLKAQFFGWLIKKFFHPEISLIFHEHGKVLKNNLLIGKFLNWVKKDVDMFIAVSELTKRQLIERSNIPQNIISVLYNYIDLDKYDKNINSQDQEKELEVPKNNFVVGFAGRLIPRKGWQDYLAAANQLLEEKDILFIIAGSGKNKKSLVRRITELNLEENTNYLGYVKDMVWFYSLLDCLVVPSWWEAMGLILLEAMAMEVPVIAANVPALNELIISGENGLLFQPRSVKDLTRKIKQLRNTPKLQDRLTQNGRDVVKKFSLTNYQKELYRLYSSL